MRPRLLLVLLLAAPVPGAAQDMADRLCPVLASVAAETAGFAPEGVQAQLVMAVAEAYDYDPAALAEVQAGADQAAISVCPGPRQTLLDALRISSLSEALR